MKKKYFSIAAILTGLALGVTGCGGADGAGVEL